MLIIRPPGPCMFLERPYRLILRAKFMKLHIFTYFMKPIWIRHSRSLAAKTVLFVMRLIFILLTLRGWLR